MSLARAFLALAIGTQHNFYWLVGVRNNIAQGEHSVSQCSTWNSGRLPVSGLSLLEQPGISVYRLFGGLLARAHPGPGHAGVARLITGVVFGVGIDILSLGRV